MGTTAIIDEIRQELKKLAENPDNVKDYSRFHKDGKPHIGLASSVTKKFYAEKFRHVKHIGKKEIFVLCEKLLKCGDDSCRKMAFDWAFRMKKQYAKEDRIIFEKWLDAYVDTWESCDDFCTHALGYHLFVFPESIPKIHQWTKSKNMWKRRASAVIFIYSARKGKYGNEILKIAESLLLDEEDLVQKAYGWMLKETSNVNEKMVFDFVMQYKSSMPRTALRYAIEKMPIHLKKQAMRR